MEGQKNELDLMSLLVQKNREIRRKCQMRWDEEQGVHMAESEWIVIRFVSERTHTVSDLAKMLGMTRQASHKIVKGLEEKGLIATEDSENYKNRRYVFLTAEGKRYYKLYRSLKKKLLRQIEENIGTENTENLKTVLSADWGLGA